jgi:hypothetical protein
VTSTRSQGGSGSSGVSNTIADGQMVGIGNYPLDELTKIADVQGSTRTVEIRSKDHGWQIAA